MTLHHSHRHEQASITAGPPRPQTVLLSCSVAVLLGGMVFQSAALDAGSAGYALLTVAVACTIVAAVFLFVWMLAVETRRTCRRDVPAPRPGRGHHLAPPPPPPPVPVGPDSVWTHNPLSVSARGSGGKAAAESTAAAGVLPTSSSVDSTRALAAARIQAAARGSVVRRQLLDRVTRRTAGAAGAPGRGTGGAAVGVERVAAGRAGPGTTAAPHSAPASVTRLSYVSPSGWQLFVDADDGDEFYYNPRTLASQRRVPADYKYVSPAGWTEYVDEAGDRFYVNVHTEAVMWERPSDHE